MKNILKNLKKIRHAFVAYNTNIDDIVHVNKQLEKLNKLVERAEPKLFDKIQKPEQLFSCLLYSMKSGEALETPMTTETANWLKQHINPNEKNMGGQAGIMSNFLSKLGVKSLLYTPFLSKEQAHLFHKNVLWWKNSKPASESAKDDPIKENWIFEYKEGAEIVGIKPKNNGRFIAASRPKGYNFDLDTSEEFINEIDFAILSGFQNIKEDANSNKQFKKVHNIFDELNRAGKPIHLEIVSTSSKKIRKKILKLVPKVESVGLDSAELNQILALENKEEVKKIDDVHEGLKYLLDMGANKIHLHTSGYFLAICKDDYQINPKEIKKALEFAAITTATEAITDIENPKDIEKGLSVPISKKGRELQKKLKKHLDLKNGVGKKNGIYTIMVPNRMAKNPKDIVGLGDIVSSSIFAAENSFKLS